MATKKKEKTEEKSPGASSSTSLLHDAAEKKLEDSPSVRYGMKGQTAEEIIHELKVHQIELEMQAEELRGAQLALAESRDQYLDLYEFAPLGYLTLTDTALISRSNLTAAVLLGIDRTKLINARFRKWIVPEDLEIWDRYFTNLLQSEMKLTATLVLKRSDGATFPARLESIRLTGSSDGKLIRVAISDISDIRKVEKELKTSEERFRLALRNAPVSVAAQDKDLIFQWAYNPHSARPVDIMGKKDTDLFIPEDAARLIELKRKVFETGEEVREQIWLTMNGKRSYLDLYLEPQRDDTGQITGIGVATFDMTEQKIAADTLRQNEENLLRAQELLEAVTKGTDVIIAAQDMNFRYNFFNQAYKEEIKRLTGKDLTLGASMVDLFAEIPEEQKMAVKEWSKVLNGENVNQIVEFGDPDNPRRVYHVLHTPIRDSQGNILGAGEVAYNITKQVQVEDKLRETKEYLDNIITYANAPIIIWDPQFRITRFNQAFEHLTGRNAQEVLGQHFDILLPDTYLPPAMDLIRKTLEGERWESVEIPILHKNGEIRTVLWNSAAIFGRDGKTIVSTIAQGQDITDRKKIESEYRLRAVEYEKMNVTLNEEIRQRNLSDTTLKKTLSLLNASLESTADGIYVVDQQGRITGYNQNFMNMWNIPPALLESGENEIVVNHVLSQLKNPEGFLSSIQELLVHPARESFDTIEFNDGKIFERYSKPQKIGDSVVGRVWSFRDSTDRKLAEEAKIASEIRYRRLFETAQDGILILDAESGQIVEVNPFLITMLGFSRDQFLGKKLWEIGLFKDIVANKDNFEELQRKEYIRYEDLPLETADGRHIAVEFISNVYTVNNKKVIQCNIRDSTDRKLVEEALRQKNEEMDGYFTNTLDLLCIADTDGHFRRLNREWESALGYSPAELEGKRFLDFVHPDDMEASLGAMAELNAGKKVLQFTNRYRHRDGSYRWIEWRLFPAGNLFYASARDVTERKKMTDLIEASLAEKETLLREIHHRVKNNLQLISGLLDMTRMSSSDESTNSILTDMMLKIQTMAQIHTRLYESKQFGKISITGQIRDQVTALSNIFSHKGHEISCKINPEEVFLPVDQALPCALVVNEILSNAYKHAFKGRKKGIIEISALQENGQIRITIRDNGVGLPDNFDIDRSNSLGITLIRTIVQHQLKGSLMFMSQDGTKISMEFPVILAGT
jgi:PAS domain S-box-containing protein